MSGAISKELENDITELQEVRTKILITENRLKELKEWERILSGVEIPNQLFEQELKLVVWRDRSVEVKKDIKSSVPKDPEKQQIVWEFLESHNSLHIVTKEAIIEKPSDMTLEFLKNGGVDFKLNESVHGATFSALLRELLGMKKGFPQKILISDIPSVVNPFMYYETIIK